MVSIWRALSHGGGFLQGPQVSVIGLTVCSKFLRLQTLGNFKGLQWMRRVLKYGKIPSYFISEGERRSFFRKLMIIIIIKFSKNISWVSFFYLFHTNLVKPARINKATRCTNFNEKQNQEKRFSSLFISIGYNSLYILISIYLSKALSSRATQVVKPVFS